MPNPSKDHLRASLAERTISDALRSFAMPLGCPVGFLEHARVPSVERLPDDDPVVRTFTRDGVGVVSVPCVDDLDLDLDAHDTQELLTLTRREARPGSVVVLRAAQLMVNEDPAVVAILDDGTLVQRRAVAAAMVSNPRSTVLDMLRNDVTASDWQRAGGASPASHRIGALCGGVLVALASVEPAIGKVARVRVVVANSHRRRGYGRLVLQAATMHVLREGLLPFCRLAMNDLAARALAGGVGFVTFARALTLRVTAMRHSHATTGNDG